MGTNFNPAGLKSFAQMGFPSTYNTLPQTPQMQTPQMQVPQIQMPQAPQALPIQNPAIQSMQPLHNNCRYRNCCSRSRSGRSLFYGQSHACRSKSRKHQCSRNYRQCKSHARTRKNLYCKRKKLYG